MNKTVKILLVPTLKLKNTRKKIISFFFFFESVKIPVKDTKQTYLHRYVFLMQ